MSETPLADYLLRLHTDADAQAAYARDPDGEMERAGIGADTRAIVKRGVEDVRTELEKEAGHLYGRTHYIIYTSSGTDESPPAP